MNKNKINKKVWKNAIGARSKAMRLKLCTDNGLYCCPVSNCENNGFRSKRGCRKHVFNKHGWYYFFDIKPDIKVVLPEVNTRLAKYTLPKRAQTSRMPMFLKNCSVGNAFKLWLESPGGGGKGIDQSDQLTCKVLKFCKFCCHDVSITWDIPETVIDFCLGSITMISDFVEYLQKTWILGCSGIIGYMNAIGHMLDYRRTIGQCKNNSSVFVATEIYLQRIKRYLAKKQKVKLTSLLSTEYLNSINCCATPEDLQTVIPYHSEKYQQIILNAASSTFIPPHDLSFCTAFIVAVLFLMVKASRPMTFKYLTIDMIKSAQLNGIIDQTKFKTQDRYGFDSLIFNTNVLTLINGYIDNIRNRLNPSCSYLLICRNGNQLVNFSSVFGRIVFQAIGKYINPTRYRQIIETESATNLSHEEQSILSEDQKHTSRVAKIHYQKLHSQYVAKKGQECMDKLRDKSGTLDSIALINNVTDPINNDFIIENRTECTDVNKVNQSNIRQKKVPFSSIEDSFLKKGIKKYGLGRWTSILNDNEYKFHSTRKTSTLAVRAKKLVAIP